MRAKYLIFLQVGFYRPVLFFFKFLNLSFAFNYQSYGDALYPSRREAVANFSPQKRRELVANETIQRPARLLGVHEVHVQFARRFQRIEYRRLGDFMKDYPLRFL